MVARGAQLALASAGASATVPCGTAGTPSTTVYLPNITKTLGGPQGWDTPFYVQNAGAVQTTVEETFYRFSDGAPVACRRTLALAPGTSTTDDPDTDTYLADDTQYSVVLRSYGAPIVATVSQMQGTGVTTEAASYSGSSAGATKVYLPNVTRRFYGYDVPFIMQNLGTATAMVSARFISFDGTQQLTVSRVIEPGRSQVVDPDSDDPLLGAPGLTDGTQYAVTLTASQPIAVVANAHDEAIGPVAFSHNGLAEGATTLHAPYAVKLLNGPFSPIVVQNVGAATADATLTFLPLGGGGAQQVFTLKAIVPGGSRAFDPRFSLGTTSPCATATPNVCLGYGEYSLTIDSTTPVAAVVMPNSATTAAGYLAATTFQPRSVLPVVMSNLGGPAGWTTSVFVARGTATQATIRYYSAATGALAATQQLALIASGTRIDPRGVAGLSDNASYSVTIDGNGGTLTAVALQQAFTGGDAYMMYEGFGGPSLPISPQPGSVRVSSESDTIVAGASAQFAASVLDQFGVPLTGPSVAWSVAPASLGTISPSGVFTTTGAVGGSGTITATTGALSTSVQVTVEVPTPSTVGGIAFLGTTTSALDLYTEASISRADMQRIVTQSIADVAQIQADYATGYTHRPAVYVLASPASFSAAAQSIGGAAAPSSWAAGECACSAGSNLIFLDWADEAGLAQIRDLRHELTHAMAHDLADDAFLPAWFDEGNARAEEFSVPGTSWFEMLQRYRAASMAAQGSLYALADLVSPYTWAARPELAATYEYAVAAEAVELLRADLGMSGEIAILRAMGQGMTFEQAYAAVANGPFDTFAIRYGARIRALAPSYPGIATAPDAPTGGGVTFVVYGLPASATFSLTITGANGSFGGGLRAADAYGVYYSYLTTGWAPGAYTLSATWAGGSVSTSVVKTSSFDAFAMLDGEPSSVP